VLLGDGGVVTGVRFSYAYASGAFPGGGASAANFSLVAVAFDPCSDAPPVPIATLYQSPPLAGFPFADCNLFTPQAPGGFLAAGDDVWSGSVTVAEAEAKCSALPACVAFTFAGAEVAPAGPVNAYLKSAVDFVAAPGWQTYVSSKVSGEAPRRHGRGAHNHSGPHHRHHHRHGDGHGHGHHHGAARRVTMAAALGGDGGSAGEVAPPPSCFSPPVTVNITGLALSTQAGFQLSLVFHNADMNARLLLPMEVGLIWR